MISIIISLFLSGMFFGSGPCMASCGPLIISYVAGTRKNVFKGLITYGLFSLARISVYLLLGIGVYFLGNVALEGFLGDFSRYIIVIGGCFIVLVGLLMALGKRLELKFCHSLEKNMLEHDKKSILALGFITGLLPCVPLLVILSYIGLVSKSWIASLLYAFSFGVGTMFSPLILLVVIAGLIPRCLIDKSYDRWFNLACGIIIIFLGLQLIMGVF
ncbi:MAG: sulfite exporter TauE/SafE family protein [Candidatus Omnitrophica bacterium]|nr:sulfite exporter TauE/SafE family protein [Candidatus Omnitrophota bacterium]